MLRDKICGPNFLIYAIAKGMSKSENLSCPEGFTIQSFNNWLQVDQSLRNVIEEDFKDEHWGKPEWFDLGWRLWIGTFNGQPAILSWTRSGRQSSDFFYPLTEDCILIWQTVTFPRFRGRGLFSILLHYILKTMLEQGVEMVYVSCRDFNYPSSKAILKAGFKLIGYGKRNKFTGMGQFYSAKKLFTLG